MLPFRNKSFFSILKLPILDISSFQSSPQTLRNEISSQIAEASKTHGFFLVKPISFQFSAFFQSSNDFFSQSKDLKLSIKNKTQGLTRGYIGMGEESGSDQYEVKEAFSYGFNWPQEKPIENPLQGPNIFPENKAFFKETLSQAYDSMCSNAFPLTQLKVWLFNKVFVKKDILWIFHYLPSNKAQISAINEENRI